MEGREGEEGMKGQLSSHQILLDIIVYQHKVYSNRNMVGLRNKSKVEKEDVKK